MVPTCSWTQPPTQSHLSVVEYCANDMFVLASKHQAVLSSVPSGFPLQKRGQMFWGPSAYPAWCCYGTFNISVPSHFIAGVCSVNSNLNDNLLCKLNL